MEKVFSLSLLCVCLCRSLYKIEDDKTAPVSTTQQHTHSVVEELCVCVRARVCEEKKKEKSGNGFYCGL